MLFSLSLPLSTATKNNLCTALSLLYFQTILLNFPLYPSAMRENKPILRFETIPGLTLFDTTKRDDFLHRKTRLTYHLDNGSGSARKFACISMADKREQRRDFAPTLTQLLNHPLAALAYVPRDVAIFAAGAVAGAVAKTVTAPLDRVKLLMQVITFSFPFFIYIRDLKILHNSFS